MTDEKVDWGHKLYIRQRRHGELLRDLRELAPVYTRGKRCTTSYKNLNVNELEALLKALGVRHPCQERQHR